jgi:hypothetical protein
MAIAWPDEVTVLGRKFQVRYCSDSTAPNLGAIDEERLAIQIYCAHMSKEVIYSTLLHEIIHAVSDTLGDEFDEPVVTRFAVSLSDTLIRNGLVEFPGQSERVIKNGTTGRIDKGGRRGRNKKGG